MPDTFGARLRRRREEQHIALTTIAGQTKIKLSLLEGLERDDVSHWPSGLYRRSFMRAYARAIGLDPDTVVREFLEIHPEPEEAIASAAALAAALDAGRKQDGAQNRLRSLVDSAFSMIRRGAVSEDEATAAPSPGHQKAAPDDQAAAEATFLASDQRDLIDEVVPILVPAPPAPVDDRAATQPAGFDPDLAAVARLCTRFCRVENSTDLQPLLEEAAGILDATGLIVWVWDGIVEELRPALVHGYSDKVVAQLPAVGRDTDNATAAAFRTARICAISGALVLPLITPGGCAGVLAIELREGQEQTKSIRAVATIVAALLAQLLGGARPVAAHAETAAAAETHEDGPSYRRATLTH